ncbi:MAG: putative baseplate assembly protein [Chloroflexi bacterium]|nr:putative baseplate assembly protein [Chloroflexota bacterium]
MPLIAPKLDERTFDSLLRDARLRIPQYNPEWTDFNESDPGITLLQLYAWLTEIMLFEMNRLPDLNYIKFLQMIGMELNPAQPAIAHVTFTPDGSGTVSLPQYSRLEASPPGGLPVTFELRRGLDVTATPLTAVWVFDGSRFYDVTALNNDLLGDTFPPLGGQPAPGNMLYLGFDLPQQNLNPPLTADKIFPPRISLRVFMQQSITAGEPQSASEVRNPPPAPVTLVWEAYHADFQRWLPLVVEDKTEAFQREDYIFLSAPPRPKAMNPPGITLETSLYWIRCRLESGSYPSGSIPRIDFIRANVVEVESLATVTDELLGSSDGRPDQVFPLSRRPIQPDSLILEVRQNEVDASPGAAVLLTQNAPDRDNSPWQRKGDFLGSKARDQHYTLNATTGEIRFGNGINGMVPPAGLEIVARSYRYGGGTSSNVGVNVITSLNSNVQGAAALQVTNERSAVGGTDEESVEGKTSKAPGQLRSLGRAVSADDYEALARQIGGVAKAVAVPLMNPNFPGIAAPGAVTVVIVPEGEEECANRRSAPPKPSSNLIREVLRSLDSKRPIATELYVKGPDYTEVCVTATVEVNPQAAFGAVRDSILKALCESPILDPYKQRFGQDFYPTNLYSVILSVSEVRAVKRLVVKVNGNELDQADMNQPYPINPDGLVFGLDHQIIVKPASDS